MLREQPSNLSWMVEETFAVLSVHCSILHEFSQSECIPELQRAFFFLSSQVLDEHGKNVTICVPNFGQDLYRDKTLVAGLGTAILCVCILYSW